MQRYVPIDYHQLTIEPCFVPAFFAKHLIHCQTIRVIGFEGPNAESQQLA